MKKTAILLCIMLMVCGFTFAEQTCKKSEEEAAVKEVLVECYVKAVHIDRNVEAFKKGFHQDFSMLMPENDGFKKISRDTWVGWIEDSLKKQPTRPKPNVDYKIPILDVTGSAAAAKVEIYKDGKHIFSDYFQLYKFSNGWQIISKSYFTHKKK